MCLSKDANYFRWRLIKSISVFTRYFVKVLNTKVILFNEFWFPNIELYHLIGPFSLGLDAVEALEAYEPLTCAIARRSSINLCKKMAQIVKRQFIKDVKNNHNT